MKTFVLNADATFEAEDIDDALARLAYHFLALTIGENSNLFTGGEIRVAVPDNSLTRACTRCLIAEGSSTVPMPKPITDENILIDDNSPDWTCIYCGHQWPSTEPVKVLQDHIFVCDVHPTGRALKALEDLADAMPPNFEAAMNLSVEQAQGMLDARQRAREVWKSIWNAQA